MSKSNPSWLEVGLPTLDRPFGIALWPIFSKAFEAIRGYKPEDFRFIEGKTPMATFSESITGLILYYVIIFGGREIMRNRQPFKFNTAFKIHNFYLTLISGGLLLLFLEQLIPTLATRGVYFGICHRKGGWTNELVILYYLNYLTKYLEFIDTIFLTVRKKPLTFLHTYHHGATALLCFSQLLGHTSVSWVPITLNLTVHCVMYWYYFQAARGIKIWWKKYITMMQIIQFVLDLGFVYFASYTYFTSTYFPSMPNMGSCSGEEFAAFSGVSILTSYLFLFIGFYLSTYKKPAPKNRSRSVSALKDMASEEVPTMGETRRRLSGAYKEQVKPALENAAETVGAATGTDTNGATRQTRSRKA